MIRPVFYYHLSLTDW